VHLTNLLRKKSYQTNSFDGNYALGVFMLQQNQTFQTQPDMVLAVSRVVYFKKLAFGEIPSAQIISAVQIYAHIHTHTHT
jgi:hypothetical protein